MAVTSKSNFLSLDSFENISFYLNSTSLVKNISTTALGSIAAFGSIIYYKSRGEARAVRSDIKNPILIADDKDRLHNIKKIAFVGLITILGVYGFKPLCKSLIENGATELQKSCCLSLIYGFFGSVLQVNTSAISFLQIESEKAEKIRNIIANIAMIPLIATCGNPMLAHSLAYIGAQVFVKTCEKMFNSVVKFEKVNCITVGRFHYTKNVVTLNLGVFGKYVPYESFPEIDYGL